MKQNKTGNSNKKPSPEVSSKSLTPRSRSDIDKVLYYILIFLLLSMVSVMATTKLFIDDDVFWHLATGKFIVNSGFVIPSADIFGYVTAGTQWIPFEWGWDVLTYFIYTIGGISGLSVIRLVLVLLIFIPVFIIGKKTRIPLPLLTVILLLVATGMLVRFTVRPHLVTYVFLMAEVFLLFYSVSDPKYKKLFVLFPVFFLIWANLHMGVILGLAILVIFYISELLNTRIAKRPAAFENRRFLLILLLSFMACLVNPHHYQTYIYAYSHSQMWMLDEILEWKSPFDPRVSGFYYVKLYFFFLILGLIVLYYSYKRKDFFPALLYAFSAVYSTQSLRFIYDYFIIITIPIVVSIAYLINSNKSRRLNAVFNSRISFGILSVFLIWLTVSLYNNSIYTGILNNKFRETGWSVNEKFFPVQMFGFMEKENIPAISSNVFNSMRIGGYYIWSFNDELNFIDSRNLNDEIMAEYKSIDGRQSGFEEKLKKYNIDCIVYSLPYLTTSAQEIEKNLVSYLSRSENWKLIYWDDISLLFVRNDDKFKGIIDKYEYKYITPTNFIFRRNELSAALQNDRSPFINEVKRKKAEEPNGRIINDIIKRFGLN